MKKWGLFIFLLAISCKKPFMPVLSTSDNNSYLVVEGTINGAADSTVIRISRTKKVDTLKTIIPETNARVNVESDGNNTYSLTETFAGTYVSAPINLDASHKYRVRVKTVGSKEYVSDFVLVKNAPPIDSVGFVAKSEGVLIYVNSHDAANATKYYRWDFNEDWQFHSKYAAGYKVNANRNKIEPRKVSEQIYDCFANDKSSNIIIASTTKLINDVIYHTPITLVPANSEKIETKYSILVKQYALTSEGYDFWDNLQKNTERLGSIFDVLPSQAQSNYHCVSNPSELVIGYLSVGQVSSKRIFISASQLLPTYSPVYPCDCKQDTIFANNPRLSDPNLLDARSPYLTIMGLFIPPANPFGLPTAFTYSTILCVDCTVRGTKIPPAFWK
jgi:hypothetical protein